MSKVLIDAIGLCDVDLVRKILLNDNIKIFNKKKDALIEASLRGYEEIVDVLLKDSRCDPNNKGCYALLCAMKGLHFGTAMLIIEHGAIDLTFSGAILLDIFENWKKDSVIRPNHYSSLYQDFFANNDSILLNVRLNDEKDILRMEKLCKNYIKKHCQPENDRGYVVMIVEYVYDVNFFIRRGFLPDFKTDNHILEDYLLHEEHKNRDHILDFWHSTSKNRTIFAHFENLKTCRLWKYCSLEYRKRKAIEGCDSFGLMNFPYTSEKLVYKSKRPLTNMSLFDLGVRYENADIISETNGIGIIKILGAEWNFARVTRYAKGMSRGLYYERSYDNEDSAYGGVFYYLEEESDVLLLFKTLKTYRNKYCAILDLCPSVVNGVFHGTPHVKDFLSGKSNLPDDLVMTAYDAWKYVKDVEDSNIHIKTAKESIVKKLPQEARYTGKVLGFYAIEDVFDQDLYQIADKKGIDVLIFEKMVGSRQVVSEVLHAKKKKKTSFSHLAYPK